IELLYIQLYEAEEFKLKQAFQISKELLATIFITLISNFIILIQFQLDCNDDCSRQ
ncbi:hypothetical protein Bhyg_09360, partial [Pseudolycoriella hygida]